VDLRQLANSGGCPRTRSWPWYRIVQEASTTSFGTGSIDRQRAAITTGL